MQIQLQHTCFMTATTHWLCYANMNLIENKFITCGRCFITILHKEISWIGAVVFVRRFNFAVQLHCILLYGRSVYNKIVFTSKHEGVMKEREKEREKEEEYQLTMEKMSCTLGKGIETLHTLWKRETHVVQMDLWLYEGIFNMYFFFM